MRNTEFTQIVSGVIAGEPVITSGGYALPDNTQIKVVAPDAAEKEAGDKAEKPAGSEKPAAKDKE